MIKFPFWLSWKEFSGRKIRLLLHILPVALATGFCIFIELASFSRAESVKIQTYAISPPIKIFPAGLTHEIIMQKDSGNMSISQEIIEKLKYEFKEQIHEADGRMTVKYNSGKSDNLITGFNPENVITPFYHLKNLKDNEAALGHEASKIINAREGDAIFFDGKKLNVRFLLPSLGSSEDTAIFTTLRTAQDIAKQTGQVNEISIYLKAGISTSEVAALLKNKYPELTVQTLNSGITGEKTLEASLILHGSLLNIFSTVIMMLYIFILALINIRERKLEFSTLYAIGTSGRGLIILFTIRSMIVSVTGAIIGCAAGTLFIIMFNPDSLSAIPFNGKLYAIAVLISAIAGIIATLPAAMVAGFGNHVQNLQEAWGS